MRQTQITLKLVTVLAGALLHCWLALNHADEYVSGCV